MIPSAVLIWLCCAILPTTAILIADLSLYPVSLLAALITWVYVVLLIISGLFNFRTLMESLRLRNLNETLSKSTQLAVQAKDEWVEELAVMNRRLGSETRARTSAQRGLQEAEKKILISAQTVMETHGLSSKLDQALVHLMELEGQLPDGAEQDPQWQSAKDELIRLRRLLQDAASHSRKVLDMTTNPLPMDDQQG